MQTKTIQLDIPEYLTVEQYKRLSAFDGDNKFERLAHIVCSLTGYDMEDVQYWSIESLVEIIKKYQEASSHENKCMIRNCNQDSFLEGALKVDFRKVI